MESDYCGQHRLGTIKALQLLHKIMVLCKAMGGEGIVVLS